jgi:cytochrome c551/c552
VSLFLSFFALNIFAADSFTYNDLEEIIKKNNVLTIEELLPLLPLEYRKNYTLMYESRSLDKDLITGEQPRTIIFGDDAKLVLAFADAPSNKIEVMQFDDNNKDFKFREIIFDGKKNPLNPPPEINPQKCLECHGNPPRPNWEPYNIWPGAYGSIDRSICETMIIGTKEWEFYQKFQNGNRNKGRYSHLPKEISIKTENENRIKNKRYPCPDHLENEVTISNGISTSTNGSLTDKLSRLNFSRIANLITKSPNYNQYEYLLNAFAKGCMKDKHTYSKNAQYTLDDFFVETGKKDDERKQKLNQLKNEIEKISEEQFQTRKNNFMKNNSYIKKSKDGREPINFIKENNSQGYSMEHGPFDALELVTRFKYLMDMMKIDFNNFTMSFKDGQYDFSAPQGSLYDLFNYFITPETQIMTCEELLQKSIQKFKVVNPCNNSVTPEILAPKTDHSITRDILPIAQIASKNAALKELQNCMKCHNANNGDRKVFNFDSIENMQKQFNDDPQLRVEIAERLRGMKADGEKVRIMPPKKKLDETLIKAMLESIK